jgi:hypothetical protein
MHLFMSARVQMVCTNLARPACGAWHAAVAAALAGPRYLPGHQLLYAGAGTCGRWLKGSVGAMCSRMHLSSPSSCCRPAQMSARCSLASLYPAGDLLAPCPRVAGLSADMAQSVEP